MLLKGALQMLPPALIRPALDAAMWTMQRRHAGLFRRLRRLGPATILFHPVDTPHCFLLSISQRGIRLALAGQGQPASAHISGDLRSLLHLLEGRTDSDTLFFSRDVTIAGDTAVALGFRNTLDGEAISLLDDALSMAGPLAAPARRLTLALDRRVQAARRTLAQHYRTMHRMAHDGRDTGREHDLLAAEVGVLRAAVAKQAASRRQRGGAGE